MLTSDTLENTMRRGLDWVYDHGGGLARMETESLTKDAYSVDTDNGRVTIRPLTSSERQETAIFNDAFDALRARTAKETESRNCFGRKYR